MHHRVGIGLYEAVAGYRINPVAGRVEMVENILRFQHIIVFLAGLVHDGYAPLAGRTTRQASPSVVDGSTALSIADFPAR